eukprot:g16851.t1
MEADWEKAEQLRGKAGAEASQPPKNQEAHEKLLRLRRDQPGACEELAAGYEDFIYPQEADGARVTVVQGKDEVRGALVAGYENTANMGRSEPFPEEQFAEALEERLEEEKGKKRAAKGLRMVSQIVSFVMDGLRESQLVEVKRKAVKGKEAQRVPEGAAGRQREVEKEADEEARAKRAEEQREKAMIERLVAELHDANRHLAAGMKHFAAARKWTSITKGKSVANRSGKSVCFRVVGYRRKKA